MKSILRISAAGLALASFGIASSASAATATADAQAQIMAALTVTLDATAQDLDFGTIAQNTAGGTVDLAPTSGNLTCSGGVVCSGSGESPNFDLAGAPGLTVSVSFSNPNISLAGPVGSTPMNVALVSSVPSVVLSGAGTGTFDVGGTLTVGASQAAGTYTGTLEVVALYN